MLSAGDIVLLGTDNLPAKCREEEMNRQELEGG